MSRRRLRRIEPGDVFELAVGNQFVALHSIGKHSNHGWAVRVTKPRDEGLLEAAGVTDAEELYIVLIGDLAAEEVEGHVRYVGRAALPERYRAGFPVFRASASYEPSGRHAPDSWWLDDGQREWRVGNLSEHEQHYPLRRLTPARALRDLIERGWDPEWEFKGPSAREFQKEARVPVGHGDDLASYFLLFPTKAAAVAARNQLLAEGVFRSVDIDHTGGEAGQHVVIARATRSLDLSVAEEIAQQVARRHHGDYDGSEWPLT